MLFFLLVDLSLDCCVLPIATLVIILSSDVHNTRSTVSLPSHTIRYTSFLSALRKNMVEWVYNQNGGVCNSILGDYTLRNCSVIACAYNLQIFAFAPL